jgi:hypothetical protein
MILVTKDYYRNDTIISNKMILLVIKKYSTRRPDNSLISIINFTTYGSRLNYLPKQMLILVIKSTLTRDRLCSEYHHQFY